MVTYERFIIHAMRIFLGKHHIATHAILNFIAEEIVRVHSTNELPDSSVHVDVHGVLEPKFHYVQTNERHV